MKILLGFILITIVMCVFMSCDKTVKYDDNLLFAMKLLEENPDSSYSILESITTPQKMSQRDYALYCLLLTQSIEKTYRPLLSDSLIKTSLNYFKDNMDRKLLAQSYFYAGRANEEMKNVLKAIEYYLNVIDLLVDSDENYKLLFLSHYYLGNLYSEQELFEDELLMHKKAYYYSTLLGDSMNIAYALQAIGTTFLEIEKKDSALCYYEKAASWIHLDDSISLAYIYNCVGTTYDRLEKYDLALKYANKSGNIQPEKDELCYCYILKAQIFVHMCQFDSAGIYYGKSISSDNLYTKAASYEGLADVAEMVGNCKQALRYRRIYDVYRDSIEQETYTNTITKMQEIYQNEKLVNENDSLKLSKLQMEKNIYRICLLFFIIILFIVYSYYKYRIKKEFRIRLQQKLIMQKQKEVQDIVLTQLETEQKLLVMQQKEILLREEFFKRLITVSGISLTTGKAGHIKFSNEDWDNIVNNVNVAFDNFTLKLKETYPELTDLDIRFCCLLKMNLTINDLVAIYCLDRKSIYKKKERIKKDRMHLNDSRSLNEIGSVI